MSGEDTEENEMRELEGNEPDGVKISVPDSIRPPPRDAVVLGPRRLSIELDVFEDAERRTRAILLHDAIRKAHD